MKISEESKLNNFENNHFLFEVFNHINSAFSGTEKDVLILNFEYIINVGYGQEVYPSQEFLENVKGKKILFETIYDNSKITGMHSQKIGNGLRTIDNWYSSDDDRVAIPVDPFGPDKKRGVFRRKNNNHVYEIMDNIVKEYNNDSVVLDFSSSDMHYFIASLLRGGVYSGPGKK